MKLNDQYFYTLREDARDEDSISGNLLVRAGFIKKSANGIYMILPLGKIVLDNIEQIIEEEMDGAGAQQVRMPTLIPEEVFIQSGRRDAFGKNMFALKDRYQKDYVLGPSHEELFAAAAMMNGSSYKDFPYNLYQIHTKYRDEPRPRFGLIRVREFTMKDAYSFDRNPQEMDVAYDKMADAYHNIFDRLGLDYVVVKADTGAMGGLLSEEYQALADMGEDILVLCDGCDYSSNLEVSEVITQPRTPQEDLETEKVHTPGQKTIEQISSFLQRDPADFIKTLVYLADGEPVVFLIPGDRELNETKAKKILEVNELELAPAEIVEEVTGCEPGFAGPIGLKTRTIADRSLEGGNNFITGANEKDMHLINVHPADFHVDQYGDIVEVKEGDLCPHCGKPLHFKRGIEVGNLFKLGTKYADALEFRYLDQNNELQPVWMGSYGIGLERCMAAVAEQMHDENGLIWPESIAPFFAAIVPVSSKNEAQMSFANELYENLREQGVPVLLDNRPERAGVKFKDMDLIGIPYQIVAGKGLQNGVVELKSRKDGSRSEVPVDQIGQTIAQLYAERQK